jgi:Flp pilus assembly protein CpaB
LQEYGQAASDWSKAKGGQAMQTQVRPPRQRSSGGRTLMLLGLVLALAAAGLVFYVTNSVQGVFTQTTSVVVASVNLKGGTILTLDNAQAPSVRIQDVFAVKQVDNKLVPPDAYKFTNQDALNTELNNKVITEDFLANDILRVNDPRLAAVGTTSGKSLTNYNPAAQKDGEVLVTLQQDNGSLGLQPGDTINIIATQPGAANTATSAFVMNNILVYAVDQPAPGKIMVVLSTLNSLKLASWEHSGLILTIVIRKPGDPGDASQIPPVKVGP